MDADVHIAEAASQLGVTPHYLRVLEKQGRIPVARRDLNGRIYSPGDIVNLRGMGIGRRPRKLKPLALAPNGGGRGE
jgi:hypothetical protein